MCNLLRKTDLRPLPCGIPIRFLACWIVCIIGGLFLINAYSFTSGSKTTSLECYPANSAIELNQNQPSLFVFLHPKCSCSRATLNELARLCVHRNGFDIQTIFYLPKDESESWAQTDLWKTATQLSTNKPIFDRDGKQSKTFRITTSGHLMLFAPGGKVMFSGGITDGRGHEGDNPSKSILKRVLDGETVTIHELPVFGCPINSIERIESVN